MIEFRVDGRVKRLRIADSRLVELTIGHAPVGDEPATSSSLEISPGSINAHTHLYSGLAPLGLPAPPLPPQSFLEILQRIWWRLDRALDPAALRASARYYLAEALLAGTTTVIDHHESPNLIEGSLDILAEACAELGIRALLCYGATERNGGPTEASRGLAECRRFIRENRRPTVRGVVGLHASFTVSDDTIRRAGDLCRELNTILHLHLAEDAADVVDARRRGFAGPLQRLRDLNALIPGSILAHGVHLTPADVQLANEYGCWLVQNPRSNSGNKVGYAENLVTARRVALGTDGYPARMDDERAHLAREAQAHGDGSAEVTRRAAGAYDLLGAFFDGPFFPLAAGMTADLCTMESVQSGTAVRDVYVAGKELVCAGALVNASFDEICHEAQVEAQRLWDRMQQF
jgi:cytosine/adenosine deaminase-related metal-dependent hydrolase